MRIGANKLKNHKMDIRPYILVAPLVLFLSAIFLTGIFRGFIESLGYMPELGLREWTWKYYKEVLWNREFAETLWFSFRISFWSSGIAIISGLILSFSLLRMGAKGRKVADFLRLPVLVPHFVVGLFLIQLLGQTGLFARIVYGFGWISEPSGFPGWIFHESGIGILLGYLWKEIPFVALTTYSVMSKVGERLLIVAEDFGARPFEIFRDLYLPLALPTVLSTFLILFAFSFGAYELPMLLGPTTPRTIAVQAYIDYSSADLARRPLAMVLNVIMILVSTFAAGIYYALLRKSRFNGGSHEK